MILLVAIVFVALTLAPAVCIGLVLLTEDAAGAADCIEKGQVW